ncbi:MAG: OmpA family protein [Gammaproteobacteria bacterium]
MNPNEKTNVTFKQSVLTCAVACALALSPTVSATDHARTGASKSEVAGVSTGAVIGGVLGGPVGVILGAAIGGHYGDTRHQAKTNQKLARESLSSLDSTRNRLKAALAEQERLDVELLEASEEVYALNQEMEQLFVERALVDGLQFDVHFDTDEVVLGDLDQTRLATLSELLKSLPEAEVALHGFADSRGGRTYNEVLSQDRAYAVADTLSALGVATAQIKTYAFGESQSTYAGDNVDSYSHDRRVSIRLSLPAQSAEASTENEAVPGVANVGRGQ